MEATLEYYKRRAGIKKAAEIRTELDGQKNPNPDAYVNLGITLAELHDYRDALRAFGDALRIDPKCARGYHNRGVVRVLVLQYDQAISDFDTAIRLNPSYTEAYINRGIAYQRVGRQQLASQDFRKARSLGASLASQYK